jgi:hypothetical protein
MDEDGTRGPVRHRKPRAQLRPRKAETTTVIGRRRWGARQWVALALLPFVLFAAIPALTTRSSQATPSRILASNASATEASAGRAVSQPRHTVLVVGDSLVYQSETQLRAKSTADLKVVVAARLGIAPCDWSSPAFDALLAGVRPDIVVLSFAGNAGLSAGCINQRNAYPLTALLNNYRDNLTRLADSAGATGATVIICTPPARNPVARAPQNVPSAAEKAHPTPFYGFQGVPALRTLYAKIANASYGRWYVSDAAALAVSPNFVYKRFLTCEPGDGACRHGYVQVRKGRDDAIHLDTAGNGGRRFANALVASALKIAD